MITEDKVTDLFCMADDFASYKVSYFVKIIANSLETKWLYNESYE